MNPDRRTERDGVTVTVFEEPDTVTTALDAADIEPTISLTLGREFVTSESLPTVESWVDALLAVAVAAVDDDAGTAGTVRVPRTLLATLADEANTAGTDADDAERRRAVERAYERLDYEGEVA